MQNLSEIKTHLRAAEQTRKMTNALSLLSTARMKKSMQKAQYYDEYYTRVRSAVKGLLEKAPNMSHPFLEKRPIQRAAFVMISGEKGMCGSYNQNILHYAEQIISSYNCDKYLVTIGRTAEEHFRHLGLRPKISVSGFSGTPSIKDTMSIVKAFLYGYTHGRIDNITLIFTDYQSAARQTPAHVHLLPLDIADFVDVEPEDHYKSDILFTPSPAQVLSTLVTHYAVGLIFNVIAQSLAAEYSARMRAMQDATNNADEIIADLKMRYNTARQFSITNQIMEIVSGSETQK